MAKALSTDLRRRVVDASAQGMSCRQAAERFGVSASSAIRWQRQVRMTGWRTGAYGSGLARSGAPACSMASRMPPTLCAGRLSITTTSPAASSSFNL
jgi:transposase-like protein